MTANMSIVTEPVRELTSQQAAALVAALDFLEAHGFNPTVNTWDDVAEVAVSFGASAPPAAQSA